jgi:hypothetical protein
MKGLTPDDLMPLDEYLARRRELFEAHLRYVDRYRRVRIGPRAMLLFENRQTLWFRVHEVVRIARLVEPTRVAQELALYNALLPGPDQLHAVLLFDVDESRLLEELAQWHDLQGEEIRLQMGPLGLSANLYTARPEDRCFGTAQWVEFILDEVAKKALADDRLPVTIRIDRPNYQQESGPISDEVRHALLEDLELSQRAA